MGIHEDHILPAIMDVALAGLKEEREQMVRQATGQVLEVGIGNGSNLPYYTEAADRIVGLEPCVAVVEKAEKRLKKFASKGELKVAIDRYQFVIGGGERMEFADSSFDTAIACLVFCTIPDAEGAAREVFRVLKPGGKFLFFEHVRYPEGKMQRVQEFINPAWKVFGCGCQLNRDTEAVFSRAGFEYKSIERYRNPKMSPPFAAFMIKGEAIKPA